MELKILKMMKESNMKLVVESLECYKPGNVQFKHLQEVKFDDLQTPPMLRNEALLPSTDLGQANQYDVITMFHVHYYWTTPDERIQIMSKLFDHLSPGGILFILILEKGADNQIAMRRFTKDMLVFDEPRDYQSVTVYGSDLANEELAPILESKVVEAKLLHKYQVSVDLDLSQIDDAAASVTSDLLSYVSSVDFNPLPIEVKKAVLEWVAKHCQHKQDQVYQMQQAACALMYTKNN
jgi:SAM-dependent methyltransferase